MAGPIFGASAQQTNIQTFQPGGGNDQQQQQGLRQGDSTNVQQPTQNTTPRGTEASQTQSTNTQQENGRSGGTETVAASSNSSLQASGSENGERGSNLDISV